MDSDEVNISTSSTVAEPMEADLSFYVDFEMDSDEMDNSIIAPPFSPICVTVLDDVLPKYLH